MAVLRPRFDDHGMAHVFFLKHVAGLSRKGSYMNRIPNVTEGETMWRYFTGLVVSVLLLVTATGAAPANAVVPEPFKRAADILVGKKSISQDDRLLIAGGFADGCRKMNKKIPALSPKENDWLESEIRSGRFEAALRSLEYAKRETKNTLQACEQASTDLKNAIVSNSEPLEALAWSAFLNTILDSSLEEHVQHLKASREAPLTDQDLDVPRVLPFLAKAIINRVLTPILAKGAGVPVPAQ